MRTTTTPTNLIDKNPGSTLTTAVNSAWSRLRLLVFCVVQVPPFDSMLELPDGL